MPLIGIVKFQGSSRRSHGTITKKDSQVLLGHYTNLVKRGNSWLEFDDLTCRCDSRTENYKMTPHLLVYYNKKC